MMRDIINDGTLWGRPWNVGHTCFLNSTQKHIKLTLRVTRDFIVNCSSEKMSESIVIKKVKGDMMSSGRYY